jgi:tight adherence protein B
MGIMIGIGIFITVILLIEVAYFGWRRLSESESRSIRRRLRTLSAGGGDMREVDIVRRRTMSQVPWLDRLLLKMTRIRQLDRLLEQANTSMPLGFFILLSLLLAAIAFAGGGILRMSLFLIVIFALLLASLPFLYLLTLQQKRMAKFQEQLPDAMDLIARALRAGHAFSGGLKMVAEEFGDPIGNEFRKTLEEINFGVGVEQAMKNLASRVDCADLQFFVVSVIIQRETGGNLAEILEKIAFLVRERFKLYGKIRALAAEGKLSAIILLGLPPSLAVYMFMVNREYIGLLVQDPIGIVMLVSAISLMVAGVFVMKRMITIRV